MMSKYFGSLYFRSLYFNKHFSHESVVRFGCLDVSISSLPFLSSNLYALNQLFCCELLPARLILQTSISFAYVSVISCGQPGDNQSPGSKPISYSS